MPSRKSKKQTGPTDRWREKGDPVGKQNSNGDNPAPAQTTPSRSPECPQQAQVLAIATDHNYVHPLANPDPEPVPASDSGQDEDSSVSDQLHQLRRKLHYHSLRAKRAEHHAYFLQDCMENKVYPIGLMVEKQINTMKGTATDKLPPSRKSCTPAPWI